MFKYSVAQDIFLNKAKLKLFSLGIIVLFLSACGGDSNDSDSMEEEASLGTITEIAANNSDFSTLVTALQATGLDAALDDEAETYTVFAPTNAAFEALGADTINALLADTDTLSDILLYHVVAGAEADSTAAVASAGSTVEMANGDLAALALSGSDLYVNLSLVISTDIEADNGIIHVIDSVMIPPNEVGQPTENIVETAVNAGTFNTLVTALQTAGLDSVLADENETFTVFAPTDAAFSMIPSATLNALLADTDALSAVLLQHVISGAQVNSVTAFTLSGTDAETASGALIDIMIDDGDLYVGGAKVETFDIYTTNGVIHVIDTVIVGDLMLP